MVDAMRSRGLELGIWYIRGAFSPAVSAKTQVKGTEYTLDQIVNQDPEDPGECLWDKVQIAINASHPGALRPCLASSQGASPLSMLLVECVCA